MGLVGLGNVIGSQKTARLPFSLGGLKGSSSFSLLVARIDDCDMPVEGALAITDVAFGVAFWKTGLLINGRTVAVGAVVLVAFLKGAIGAEINSGFADSSGLVGGSGFGGVVAGGETGVVAVGEVVVVVVGDVGFVVLRELGDIVGRIGVGDFSLLSNFLSITDTIGERPLDLLAWENSLFLVFSISVKVGDNTFLSLSIAVGDCSLVL